MSIVTKAKSVVKTFIAALKSEVPLIAGVAYAAYTTATDHSIKGYATAVGIALIRFVVTPAYRKAKAKAVADVQAAVATVDPTPPAAPPAA